MRRGSWCVVALVAAAACGDDSGVAGEGTTDVATTTTTTTMSTSTTADTSSSTSGASSSTTGDVPSSSSGDTSSSESSESESSTGEPTTCGNGALDPDEDCDDGDTVHGNGCNVDCRISGELVWFVDDGSVPEAIHQGDSGASIAVSDDGTIFAAGHLMPVFPTFAWVAAYTPEGDELWRQTVTEEFTAGVGIATFAGELVLLRVNGGPGVFLASLDPEDGTELATATFDFDAEGVGGYRLVSGPDGIYGIAGTAIGDWTRAFRVGSDLSIEWWGEMIGTPPMYAYAPSSTSLAFDADGGRALYLGWEYDAGVARWDADGLAQPGFALEVWPRFIETAMTQDGDLVAVGHTSEAQGSELVLARYTLDGDEVWTHVRPNTVYPELVAMAWGTAIAVDEHGDVIAAGGEFGGVATTGWLARFTPDGEVMWEQDVRLDDYHTAIADLAIAPEGDVLMTGQWRPLDLQAPGGYDPQIFVARFRG